jgi:hypothetical protein
MIWKNKIDKEEIEYRKDIIDQVFYEIGIDYETFVHIAIQCIYEIHDLLSIDPLNSLYLSKNSKSVVNVIREIAIRYFELENHKEKFNIYMKEEENG